MAEYSKYVKGEWLKPIICPRNEGCKCTMQNCNNCGWNPEEEKCRKESYYGNE